MILNNNKENTFCLPYLERLLKVTEEYFVYYKENYPSGLCIANNKIKKVRFIPLEYVAYGHIAIKDNWVYLEQNINENHSLVRVNVNSGEKELIFETDNIFKYLISDSKIYLTTGHSSSSQDSHILYSMNLDGKELSRICKDIHSFKLCDSSIFALSFLDEEYRSEAIIYKIDPFNNTCEKIYGPSEAGIICLADEENILTSIYPSKFILFNKNNPSGKIFDTQYHQESGIDTFHIAKNILYEVS